MKTIASAPDGRVEIRVVADVEAGGYRLIRDDGANVTVSDPFIDVLKIAPLLPDHLAHELLDAITRDTPFDEPVEIEILDEAVLAEATYTALGEPVRLRLMRAADGAYSLSHGVDAAVVTTPIGTRGELGAM